VTYYVSATLSVVCYFIANKRHNKWTDKAKCSI